jgi:hypothetical protein
MTLSNPTGARQALALAGWCASLTWCVGLAAMMRSRLARSGHLTVA